MLFFRDLRLEVFPEDGGDVLQDAFGNVGLVHGIDVHVRDAVGVQVDNLVGCIDDACLLHGVRIAAEFIDERLESLWHERARELDGAFDLVCVRDGHDAGEHRAVDASVAEFVQKTEEKVVVENHLRGEEVCTGFNFFFEVFDVFGLVRAFGVLFGVAGGANAKVGIACLEFADEFHGVVVVAIATAICDKFRREVATECHHVLDACGLHVFDALVDSFLGARNASEVGKHRNVEFVFEILRDFKRVLADSAACAVSDAHECGMERGDGFSCGFHVFKTCFFLGREHLEGKAHLVLLENVDNFHLENS